MDTSTNTLKITSKDNVAYDTAQLTNMETKEVFAKISLDNSKNIIDLKNIKPGKHILILSNVAGQILTEDLYIF